MNVFSIGGREYNVLVVGLTEEFNKLYSENTGRTRGENLKMELDCLGVFFSHKITVQRKKGYESEYDELYDLLTQPTDEGIPIKVVHNQTTIDYDAYISTGSRTLKRVDEKTGKVYWDKLTINAIPMEAWAVKK